MTDQILSLRNYFPSLNQSANDSGLLPVFFDNPAGTQVPQPAIDAVTHYFTHMNANSGGVFATSRRSDTLVQQVREQMADFINAPSAEEIVFGANMTTLNFSLSRALAKTLRPGDEIILTRMDHDANVAPWLRAAEDHQLVVRWVDINPHDCTLDMNTLEAALTERTRVVATVHASNAVGTINPVAQIGAMAHAAGALYVIDAVQSTPHIPIDVQAHNCDFLLCSAYKFFGPHIGILWGKYDLLTSLPVYKVRPSKDVPPHRWETGTGSYETIAAVGGALTYLEQVGQQFGAAFAPDYAGFTGRRLTYKTAMAALSAYERDLCAHLLQTLTALPGLRVYGITAAERLHERVPTVVFTHEMHTPHTIATHLAHHHIYVWHGNYYAVEIMERLGHAQHGMLRVGLAHYNTHEEIDRLDAALRHLFFGER